MCKSIAEGGLRCAAHTRTPYTKALESFGRSPSAEDIDRLSAAATNYASTPSGAKVIEKTLRDLPQNSHLRDLLSSSLARGLSEYYEHRRISDDIANRARGRAVTAWAQQVPSSKIADTKYQSMLAEDLDLDSASFNLAWNVAYAESEGTTAEDLDFLPARFLVQDSAGNYSATPLDPRYLRVAQNFEKLASYARQKKRMRPDRVDSHGNYWLRYENNQLSEVLRFVDYDPSTGHLSVGIVNKESKEPVTYTYRGVSQDLVDHLCSARSMGRFYAYVFSPHSEGSDFSGKTLRDFSFTAHISNNMMPTSYDFGPVPKDIHKRIAFPV